MVYVLLRFIQVELACFKEIRLFKKGVLYLDSLVLISVYA